MDNSTITTPKASTASQQQQHLSSYEDEVLHDLATLFDPSHFLDNTVEFVDPQLIEQDVDSNIQQEAPAVNPEFVDMTDWSEQAMADILSMEEQQQQQQQQQQQHQLTQPLALSNNNNNSNNNITSTKKRRHGGVVNKNTTNKKKKNENKENQPPPASSSSSSSSSSS